MNDDERDIETLLPWYLNGSLAADERARVEARLAADPAIAAELDWLRSLAGQLRREPQPVGPGELGLRRLLRDVRAEQARAAPRRSWQPWLATAALLLIVVQGAALLRMSGQPDVYRPLSGPGAETPLLQVRFQPQATEAQIRQALLELDAVIVDGPSASGVYRLRLLDSAVATEERVEALRGRGELILELVPE